MRQTKEQNVRLIAEKLADYLPKGTAEPIAELLLNNNAILKITRARKTKLGDYRPNPDGIHHHISINHNLNQYAFIITLVHELAHLYQFRTYGRKAKPHGDEWKSYFQQLMKPFLTRNIFPEKVALALNCYMANPKAASCVDVPLQRALAAYDPVDDNTCTVAELQPQQRFLYQKNREFRLEGIMRKRYRCIELATGRAFAFSPVAQVKPL